MHIRQRPRVHFLRFVGMDIEVRIVFWCFSAWNTRLAGQRPNGVLLTFAHNARNKAEYEGYFEVAEQDLTDLIALAERLVADVQKAVAPG